MMLCSSPHWQTASYKIIDFYQTLIYRDVKSYRYRSRHCVLVSFSFPTIPILLKVNPSLIFFTVVLGSGKMIV